MLQRLKLFLHTRPPLALLAFVLLICSLGLLILDGRIHIYEVKDPDVEKHWNKLLLELSNLEFCFKNSTYAKTLSDSYAAADVLSDNFAPSFYAEKNADVLTSQSVEQRVLLYPTEAFNPNVGYMLTAAMRGRHIAIKGPLALQPFNVSFAVYTQIPVIKHDERTLEAIHLHACVTFFGSRRILPVTTKRRACRSPKEVRTQYGLLEWTKRSHLLSANRCKGRIRLHTDFNISPHLLPHLNQESIALVSFRLRVMAITSFTSMVMLLGFGAYYSDLSAVYRRNKLLTLSSLGQIVSEL